MNRWIRDHWRPYMAMQYMVVCIFDFVIFPIGWALLQDKHGGLLAQWVPLTLSNGGLYHGAMAAVVGISAWGRTKEKMNEPTTPNT